MRVRILLFAVSVTVLGCRFTPPPTSVCEKSLVFENTAPRVESQHQKLAHWTQRLGSQADTVLLKARDIEKLNQKNQESPGGFQDIFGIKIGNQERVSRELGERQEWLAERLKSGHFVEDKRGAFDRAFVQIAKALQVDEFRVVHQETTLFCIPMISALFTRPIDRAFNRNRCSSLHPTEIVRVLRASKSGWLYVHSGHSVGWLRPDKLTPPLAVADVRKYRDHPQRLIVLEDTVLGGNGVTFRMGSSVPLLARTATGFRVQLPQASGFQEIDIQDGSNVQAGFLALTRRNLFRVLFSVLNQPYGWGGKDGGRDCSRLVLDVFSTFGLQLGRHSTVQSRSGMRSVDLTGKSPQQKLAAIRSASRAGVVLLYMRGHIMVYLNESNGRPYAISSISEYMRPCGKKQEQVVRLDRVAVTDLALGKETTRKSFLNRLVRLAVFGQ